MIFSRRFPPRQARRAKRKASLAGRGRTAWLKITLTNKKTFTTVQSFILYK